MSSSTVLLRHVGKEFEWEKYEEVDKIAQWLYKVDNSPNEKGFRSKLKRFWKKTRIPSVVKKVVAGSKSLLNRLTSRLTPNDTPPESVHARKKTVAPAMVKVNFPEDMAPSPASSSDEPLTSAKSAHIPSSSPSPSPSPSPKSASNVIPSLCLAVSDQIVDNPVSRAETDDEKSFSKIRYKESKLGKQVHFPEIEVGVVGSRVKWLEPLFSGERADVVDLCWQPTGTAPDASRNQCEKPDQALEIHVSSGLALRRNESKVGMAPSMTESDEESVFDDSPRLYKHRLPEQEPKPWVEPGTVFNGAMWLAPILSGEKRPGSGDSADGNSTSPTAVDQGNFC